MSLIVDNERFRYLLRLRPELAIEQLSKYHMKDLFRVSFGLTRNRAASEEIVQETLIHVWEKREELSADTRQSIQHYLVKVIRNKSISYFTFHERLQGYMKRLVVDLESTVEEAPVESSLIEAETKVLLWKIVSGFPRRERECLMMRLVDGLPPDEIAARLGIGRKAVEANITRTNKRLKEYAHLFR